MSYFLQGLRSDIRQLVDMNEPKTFAEAEKAARFAASVSRVLQPANKSSSSEQGLLIKLLNHEPASQPSNSEDKMLSIMEQNKSLVAKLSGKRNGAGLLTVKVPSSASTVRLTKQPVVAALDDPFSRSTGNASGMQDAIHQPKEMIEKLDREMDARIRALATTEPDGNPGDGNESHIAAFQFRETNKSETPELIEDIRRMERSFTRKLENL